jgi:hypothetical protein
MPYDFSATGKVARDRIPVPDLSMDVIRNASRAAARRSRSQRLVLCGALALVSIGAAAGAARIYDGVHIWLSGGKAGATVRSLALVRNPMTSDLRTIAANATFPVVMPIGLPAGTRVRQIMYSPAAHPNTIFVQYRSEKGNSIGGFFLLDPSSVDPDKTTVPMGPAQPSFSAVDQWKIGGETVVVRKGAFSADATRRIKSRMAAVSPAQTVVASESMLWRIMVLGVLGEPTSGATNQAERIAPRSGRSVLLDRGRLQSLAGLIARRKPMLDSRGVFLSDIPQTSNGPDYMKATYHWWRTIAIEPQGLRAIDAVLRSRGTSPTDCKCEILYNRPSDKAYWVWIIPQSGSSAPTKFTVDAVTFSVTR